MEVFKISDLGDQIEGEIRFLQVAWWPKVEEYANFVVRNIQLQQVA